MMKFVVVGERAYRVDTDDDIREAQAAIRAARLPDVVVYRCNADTVAEAEANGFAGKRETGMYLGG